MPGESFLVFSDFIDYTPFFKRKFASELELTGEGFSLMIEWSEPASFKLERHDVDHATTAWSCANHLGWCSRISYDQFPTSDDYIFTVLKNFRDPRSLQYHLFCGTTTKCIDCSNFTTRITDILWYIRQYFSHNSDFLKNAVEVNLWWKFWYKLVAGQNAS